MQSKNFSELWKNINWGLTRKIVFRLQTRLWKAMRAGDKARVRNLQNLILRSRSARLIAIRQITQLNAGKKTAGVDGQKSLNFQQRFELEEKLAKYTFKWKHKKLRKIAIPKKDGTKRILKVPTIADRAWQCLIKLALEPAHEAAFHERSYGFRQGRSTQDCQKILFLNLSSKVKGYEKRILELDIEKCFDRIDHKALIKKVIAPARIKQRIWQSLLAGTSVEFPEQGTPQGGVFSPLLANIALNGIEAIHKSVRYADDMVFILKPFDDAKVIRSKIDDFLAQRGLKVKERKTRLVHSTDGFDFLGWHFKVQQNGKFRSTPSEENFLAFRQKVKEIVNSSNYGSKVKAEKLAPIIRGWRNYHRYCKMDGARFSLWHINNRTFKVFNKETKQNRHTAAALVKQAFPAVPWKENDFVNVKGDYTPFNGDIVYWSKRKSKLYDGHTAQALKRQDHTCGFCGYKFVDDERVELHHLDGNHGNWKTANLMAVHRTCHHYLHMLPPEREWKQTKTEKIFAKLHLKNEWVWENDQPVCNPRNIRLEPPFYSDIYENQSEYFPEEQREIERKEELKRQVIDVGLRTTQLLSRPEN